MRRGLIWKTMTERVSTNRIVIHCTATPPSMDIGVEEVRDWHVHDRGWQDVGYHFIIRRDGRIEVGRPLMQIGAHARGYNADSVAVAYAGGVNEQNEPYDNRTSYQKDSLWQLLKTLRLMWPTADVCGHCDLPGVAKACPSFSVKDWVREMARGELSA